MRLLIPFLILLPIIAISAAPTEVRTIEFPVDFVEPTTTSAPETNKDDCVIVFHAYPRHSEYDLTPVHFLMFTIGLIFGYATLSCCTKMGETLDEEMKRQSDLRNRLVAKV